ncbi:unknown [Clostridium sp. CAG:1219]|nr:unknown [Clostridium sp. CAG:1219]
MTKKQEILLDEIRQLNPSASITETIDNIVEVSGMEPSKLLLPKPFYFKGRKITNFHATKSKACVSLIVINM